MISNQSSTNEYHEALIKLQEKFKSRYESFKILKNHTYTAKAWKRAWLDVNKELRKLKNDNK